MRRTLAVAVAVLMVASLAAVASARELTAWSPVVNLAAIEGTHPDVNTAAQEGCPIESPDGRELYFASNRPGGYGGIDIWVSRRTSRDAPWGDPENLGPTINTAANDFCPSPMRGNRFYFVSERPSICGDEPGRGADIYVSRRHPQRGFGPAQNVGCAVNSAWGEASPYHLEDDRGRTELYFSSNRPSPLGASNLYVSRMGTDGRFAAPELLPVVNSTSDDARPNLRRDGLELVFDSNRPGGHGGFDAYVSTRSSTDQPWGVPQNLGPDVNSAANETRPSLSWDGFRLYVGSNRAGATGPAGVPPAPDIYVAERSKVTGRR
jgi:Tol biopolymer transport system component